MENHDREAQERKKRAIAIAFLPLSVAFFMWRLQANTTAAPPPPKPPDPIVKKAAPRIEVVAGPIRDLERSKVLVARQVGVDPFIPAFSLAVKDASAAAAPPPAEEPPVVTEVSLPTGLPALPPLKPFAPPSVIARPAEAPVKPIPPQIIAEAAQRPDMPWTLTGIVKGDPDMAILRHWDGSRRIARGGENLDKAYRLSSIEETFVVLSGGGKTATLRLGAEAPPREAPTVPGQTP